MQHNQEGDSVGVSRVWSHLFLSYDYSNEIDEDYDKMTIPPH